MTKAEIELELAKQRYYFIGVLEGLLCGTEAGADMSPQIKKLIEELRNDSTRSSKIHD